MSAVEKLFVQIFERKKWIIDQAEQQARLFDQHLVSKLLIDGIVPPPWLRNPLLQTLDSDPGELTKDDIVSEALFPQSQSTVPYSGRHCSLYSKLFVTTDDGWYPSGLHSEVLDLKKNCDAGDGLSKLPECSVNNDGCASTSAHQMECSAISPQSHWEGRTSDGYHDPALSLAKLQRSKSRQRALELRKSANTAKRCSRNDNGSVTSSLQLDHLERQDLINAFDTGGQSFANEEVRKGHRENQKVDKSNYSGRVTKSKGIAQKLDVVSSSIANELGDQSNHVNEPLETVNATCFPNESCGAQEANKGEYQTNNAYQSNNETSRDILKPDGSLKSITKSTQLSQPVSSSQQSQAPSVPVVGSFQRQKDLHICAVEAREHLTRSNSSEGRIARYSQQQDRVGGISKSFSSNFCNQNATSRSAASILSQNVQDTEIAAERSLSCQKDSNLDTEVAIDSAEKETIAAQTAGGNIRAVTTGPSEGSLRPVSSFSSDDRDSRNRCSASKRSSLVKSLYIETVVAEKASDTEENRLSAAKVTNNLKHRSDATVPKVDAGFDGLVENNSFVLQGLMLALRLRWILQF
ncbi:hypothetical protein L6164_008567 [Bauhinia variegata]|uniref:Uncharacterized protein n=1 Tax=Bauhinia variegata TaxID=167791 RepID=A0ACB9PGA9_BAUVA|nr:hypothetical protein L6164_008567 [Bauhinia variegata]